MINQQENIIWVVSYPKSGNTWVRLFLYFILTKAKSIMEDFPSLHEFPVASNRLLFDEYLGVSSSDLTNDEIQNLRPSIYKEISKVSDGLKLFKVHDAFTLTTDGHPVFPPEISRAVVYIVRNPLDIVISSASHTNRSITSCIESLNDPGYTIASGTDELKAQVPQFLGSWSDHVNSWLEQRLLPVILIKYEDLLFDSAKEFDRVLKILGIHATEEVFNLALKNCDFEHLRYLEKKHSFREKPIQSKQFFREGKAEIYRDKLDPEQIREISAKHSRLMNRFGYTR